jgi:hypothetical protein
MKVELFVHDRTDFVRMRKCIGHVLAALKSTSDDDNSGIEWMQ